jgi:hypothetical protein
MSGIDPYAYLQQVSVNFPLLTARNQVETALDEVEYLYEIISPELQDLAESLIVKLRDKLSTFE